MPRHQARTRRDPDGLPVSPPNLRPTQRTRGETPARPPPRLAGLIHEASSRAASCSFHVHAPAARAGGLRTAGYTREAKRSPTAAASRILLARFLLELRQPGESWARGAARIQCSHARATQLITEPLEAAMEARRRRGRGRGGN